MLTRFDSLFMRLYAAKAVIPPHRDEGRSRLRIVGNSGRARTVRFRLQAIGEHSCANVEDAEVNEWVVEHGWGYALSDTGAGGTRCAPWTRAASRRRRRAGGGRAARPGRLA